MKPFFQEIISIVENLHREIQAAVESLSQAGLDWVPGPEMNSLGVLLAHIAGAERNWMGEVISGEGSSRIRAAEFETKGASLEDLLARLESSLDYCRRVFEDLTLEDLAAIRVSPRDGREVTVGWALAHGLEHTAQHSGHIQVTRQMWERQSQGTN